MNTPLPTNEDDRLRALAGYAVLDTPPEVAFERITNLAARLFDMPIALVSLVDRDRQWFKSCYGLDARQTDRDLSFCAHAILADEVLVVPDAAQDARFADNALVTGEIGMRFYAGAPLKTHAGFKLGTLCVIDTVPREFSDEQRATLTDLAAMAVDALELRLAADTLQQEVAQSLQQQEALQGAEARTQQIIETAHNAFISMDAEGLITGWNGRAETTFGWPREEAIGRSLADTIVPPSFREAHWRGLAKFLETGHGPVLNQIFEISAMRRDGTEFPIELSISPLRWGESYMFTAFVHDISERKASEEALARQTIAFQEQAELLDLAHDTILVIDFDGTITFWNKSAERAYGWSAAEAIGQNDHSLLQIQLPQPLEELKDVLLRDGFWGGEAVHTNRDGTPLTVSTRWVLKRDEKGRAAQILKISNDISERKAAEAELQQEREFLKVLLESTQEGIVACDAEGNLTLFNRATRQFHGLPEQGVPAEEWAEQYDLYLADGQTPMQTADIPLFRTLQGEIVREAEMVIAPKNGTPRSLLANGQAMFDANGRKLGAVVTMHDITERKQAEAELRESRRFAESIAANSTSIIYLFDLEKLVNVYANRDVTEFLGYATEEVQAMGDKVLPTIVHPDDLPFLLAHLESFKDKADGEVVEFETRIRHANGQYRWIASREIIFKRRADGTPWQILGNSHDISAHKEAAAELEKRVAQRTADLAHANEELHRTGDRLQAIMDNTTSVIYLKDLQSRYLLLNKQFEKLFGINREQLIGKDHHEFLPTAMADALTANDQIVLQSDGPLEFEEEALQPDGVHTYISTKFPLRDGKGKVYAMGGISTDITERKRGEVALQTAKEEAERANRAKSELLSRTSHELRTPLNAILGFGQLLEMDDLDDEQQRSVQEIIKAGRHQLELVDRVLDVARTETGQLAVALEPVAVGDALREALALVLPLAAAQDVRLHLDEGANRHAHSRVLADRARLAQVLLNLLSNAVKYNRAGGNVTVSVADVENSDRLRVAVSDTGSGLAPDEVERLFRLFDRLGADEAGIAGTGIGLTLAKGLVEAMGGEIGVQSILGEGSTFWIELPRASDGAAMEVEPTARLETPPDAAPETHSVVLYIEDNLSNLKLVQHILRHRPEVRLLTAMQGGLGLELAREHRPDLILLDLHLPDIRGDEALRQLQNTAATREIPVVMISADAMPHQIEQLRAAGAVDYLTKPLDVKRFLHILDEALQPGNSTHD